MKKRTAKILCVVFMLSLTACGKDQKDTTPSMQTENVSHEEKESKTITETAEDAGQEISEMVELPEKEDEHILIAYFSVPEDVATDGVDAIAGASIVVKNGEVLGNVQYIPRQFRKQLEEIYSG